MYDPRTIERLLNHDLEGGTFVLEFLGGETKMVTVERLIHSTQGEPVYLVNSDGTVYMWTKVISIKEV